MRRMLLKSISAFFMEKDGNIDRIFPFILNITILMTDNLKVGFRQ